MKDKDFAKVYERNYKRSFLFAKSYVHDDLVAEDIAAESLFKYWQICKCFRSDAGHYTEKQSD